MFRIKIAELTVAIDNKYPQLEKFCRNYLTDEEVIDFSVKVSNEDIESEIALTESLNRNASRAYAESVCVYREICRLLPDHNAFLLHASVVECDGVSYAFAATSGTGKSTHTALWLKNFGERARIINGDKPILRITDNGIRVYGTPWCGKEGYNVNADSPLHALCFIERGENNEIVRLEPEDAVTRLARQILLPYTENGIDKLFPLLDSMLKVTPVYLLKCNISEEAVTVAYNGMKNA